MLDRRRLFVAREQSFGVDPSPSGAAYAAVPFEDVRSTDNLEVAIPELAGPSAGESLQEGGALQVSWPALGYPNVAGGGAPPSWDVTDALLANAFGPGGAFGGSPVRSGSIDRVVLEDGHGPVGDLIPLYLDGASRTYWRAISARAPSRFDVTPTWPVAPRSGDYVFGARVYAQRSVLGWDGTLAAYQEIAGAPQTLLGARFRSLRLAMQANKAARWFGELIGDSVVFDQASKADLPVAVPSRESAVVGLYPSLIFEGISRITTRSIAIDFGLVTESIADIGGAHGRASISVLDTRPIVRLEPPYAPSVWRAAMHTGRVGSLLIQLGRGELVDGRINSIAFFAPRAQVTRVDDTDKTDLRHRVEIRVLETPEGTPRWLLARC